VPHLKHVATLPWEYNSNNSNNNNSNSISNSNNDIAHIVKH